MYLNYCTAGWKNADIINVFLSSHHPVSESSKCDAWYILYLSLAAEVSQFRTHFDPIIYVTFVFIRKINDLEGWKSCLTLLCAGLLFINSCIRWDVSTFNYHIAHSQSHNCQIWTSSQFQCLVTNKNKITNNNNNITMLYTWWWTTSGNSTHTF